MDDADRDERARLLNEMYNHPFHEVQRAWKSLHLIIQVFQANQRELETLIERVETDEDLAFKLMGNIPPIDPVQDQFRLQFTRLLFNYISSVKTAAEHTRNLVRRYEGTETQREYQRRLDAVVASGRAPFLHKLRDYALHAAIPPWGQTLSFEPGEGGMTMRHTLFLDRDRLLPFKGWSAASRTFLVAQEKEIGLRDLLSSYERELSSLYAWLFAQYGELHGQDIRDLNDLIERAQGPESTPGHPDYRMQSPEV